MKADIKKGGIEDLISGMFEVLLNQAAGAGLKASDYKKCFKNTDNLQNHIVNIKKEIDATPSMVHAVHVL